MLIDVSLTFKLSHSKNVVTKTYSIFKSPFWILLKKLKTKKKWGLVIVYRQLNEIIIDDPHPVPNVGSHIRLSPVMSQHRHFEFQRIVCG